MNINKKVRLQIKYYHNELILRFLKKIKNSKNPSLKNKISLQSRVFFSFMKKNIRPTRFRNFCNLSGKPRGLVRSLKISGYSLKEKARKLQLLGVKGSS